jgi:hypothetical protein
MPTKRTPTGRLPKSRITPEAIDLFRRMRKLKCTCAPRDWAGEYWRHETCPGCKEYGRLSAQLESELKLAPWESITNPRAQIPYPAGCYAALRWQRERDERPEEQELWRALEAAAAGLITGQDDG